MASRDEKFGELRSLLQQTPGAEAWEQLCSLLDRWSHDDYFFEVVYPYTEELLKNWDDDLKIGPHSWVKPLLRKTKKAAPLLPLVTGLNLRSCRIGPKTVGYLASAPEVEHITYLDLSYNGLKNDGAVALARSQHLKNLETLLLSNTTIGNRGGVAIANSQNFASLKRLDLSGCDMIEEGCDAIQSSRYLCKEIRDMAYQWYSYERADRERYYRDPWE